MYRSEYGDCCTDDLVHFVSLPLRQNIWKSFPSLEKKKEDSVVTDSLFSEKFLLPFL